MAAIRLAAVEAAGKLWIASAKAAGLERSSIEDYERTLRLHIMPLIGAQRLNALTRAKLRAYEDDLREKGRSASMTKRVLTTLGTLLADAQKEALWCAMLHVRCKLGADRKQIAKRSARRGA